MLPVYVFRSVRQQTDLGLVLFVRSVLRSKVKQSISKLTYRLTGVLHVRCLLWSLMHGVCRRMTTHAHLAICYIEAAQRPTKQFYRFREKREDSNL